MNGELAAEISDMVEQFTGGGSEEAKGPDVVNAGERNVADEPGDELVCRERHELDAGSCFVLIPQQEIARAFPGKTAV